MKRLLDCTASLLGLLLLSPFFLVVAVLIKLDSPGPVFYRQERIGRWFRPFRILKFRSMRMEDGAPLTVGDDPRITRVGRFLRRLKIDELPQLVNVLVGDMSLVGPRPQIRKYVAMFHDDYVRILQMRPGMTDLASITYSDEASVLSCFPDPEGAYVETVQPYKIALAHRYLALASLGFDLRLIFLTFIRLSDLALASLGFDLRLISGLSFVSARPTGARAKTELNRGSQDRPRQEDPAPDFVERTYAAFPDRSPGREDRVP